MIRHGAVYDATAWTRARAIRGGTGSSRRARRSTRTLSGSRRRGDRRAARRHRPSRWNADAKASRSSCEHKRTRAPAGCTDAGTRSRPEASHPDRRGRRRARARRTLLGTRDDGVAPPPSTARRGERTGEPTRGATRGNTMSSPNRPRSPPDNGTAPHLAHPVMRHQPAHMSRDKDVDDSRCAPPADTEPSRQRCRSHLRG
jgi:hypothetical protein